MRRLTKFLTILLPIILFSPSLAIFFSSDDWFHLRVSAITHLSEFSNFFSFIRNPQSIAFYRPLTTQVFFFAFQKLFGVNPTPFHIFVLTCFAFSLYLIFRLSKKLQKTNEKALICTILYGFSVSNFTRLYFLSAFQEIALVVFSLLTITGYLNDRRSISLVYFVLALLSKETAVVLPLVLLILDWSRKKFDLKKLVPFALILLPYLYLRLFVFGPALGDTYQWNFSLAKVINTLTWYGLWSLGAPELLVDYIGSGFRPIARFFTDFPIWWGIILGLLLANLTVLGICLFGRIKKLNRQFFSCLFLFIASLLPVLFLPLHKFTLELGLPLVWFCLGVVWLLPERGKSLLIFIFFYLALNLSMNYLTYTTHYSVGRAKISQKVTEYIAEKYPEKPADSYFEFINDTRVYTKEWGSSRQIANSIGGSELFRVLYHDQNYNVYYEDSPEERPAMQRIPISSKIFLQ